MKTFRKIAKYLFTAFSILAAVSLLLSYLSAFVSPLKCWPLAFFGLVFQLLLLINLVLFGIWLLFKKKFSLIHLAAILLGIPYLGSFVQFRGKGEVKNDSDSIIKIVSYNVHTFNTMVKKGENSSSKVAKFLTDENADIVCLQEFFVFQDKQPKEETFKQQMKAFPYSHIFYNVAKRSSSFGLAIFSRFPIVGRGEFRFPSSANAASYADININGKIVRVYNNHLQSTKFNISKSLSRFAKEDERIDELVDASSMIKTAYIKRAQQVDRISKHVKASPYPAIVCGDFNDTPVSYTYRTMKGELKDAFTTAGSGIPSTYRGFFPSFRIDYIFYDKSMKALSHRVGKLTYSDHYPISAQLAL